MEEKQGILMVLVIVQQWERILKGELPAFVLRLESQTSHKRDEMQQQRVLKKRAST